MMSRARALVGIGALAAVALVAACADGVGRGGSNKNDGAAGSGGSAAVSCPAYAAAACAKLDACLPFLIEASYGSVATCEERLALSCEAQATAPGSSWGTTAAECAAGYESATCDELRSDEPGACYAIAGELDDGAACRYDSQCASTYCDVEAADGCGSCTPRFSLGQSCTSEPQACARGTVCAGTCKAPGGVGASCSSSQPCKTNLACYSGQCIEPLGEGASCLQSGGTPCDALAGLSCISGSCTAVALAAANESCGLSGGAFVACAAGGSCESGTCVAAAADGASCDSSDQCLSPAQCVNGACELPDASQCGGEPGGACAESCTPSQGSQGGQSIGGAISWDQSSTCGCEAPFSEGSQPAGGSCDSASDCVSVCCSCCGSERGYTAQACIGGQCLAASEACGLVLEEVNAEDFFEPIQCD